MKKSIIHAGFKCNVTLLTKHNFYTRQLNRRAGRLSAADLAVMWVLLDLSYYMQAYAYPAFDTIAERAGVSLRQAKRSVAKLVRLGIFTKARGKWSNEYLPIFVAGDFEELKGDEPVTVSPAGGCQIGHPPGDEPVTSLVPSLSPNTSYYSGYQAGIIIRDDAAKAARPGGRALAGREERSPACDTGGEPPGWTAAWERHCRHDGKAKAREEYSALLLRGATPEEVFIAIGNYADHVATWPAERREKAKWLFTFLRDDVWRDWLEPRSVAPKAAGTKANGKPPKAKGKRNKMDDDDDGGEVVNYWNPKIEQTDTRRPWVKPTVTMVTDPATLWQLWCKRLGRDPRDYRGGEDGLLVAGEAVLHRHFGEGRVTAANGTSPVVMFANRERSVHSSCLMRLPRLVPEISEKQSAAPLAPAV